MTDFKHISKATDGRIATITLNRENVYNAFNIEMIREIASAFRSLNDQEDIRIIIIRGNGPHFSSGADLNWMKDGQNQSREELVAESRELAGLFNHIHHSSKVTISRIHGNVMGGANGIVAATDIAVADETALFAFTEARLGLIPATIAPYIVMKTGNAVAAEWMLTARKIRSGEALQKGLIQHVTRMADLDAKVNELCKEILKNGPEALAGIKDLIWNFEHDMDQEQIIRFTSELIARYRTSKEGQEGISAFFEKRKPSWHNE